uniref:CNH domain-containing protein n=1 Tax=Caenorhabditis tropicalis TaxID=1561998 RepID=A0A1I7UWC3_9PELO
MYDAYTPNEVALRLPVEVTCLAFQESKQTVLAGGKAGHLYAYSTSSNRRGFELSHLCTNFHKKAVNTLKVCQREDLLLCTSDGQLMAHKLSDPLYKVETLIHKVKPVQTFARFSPTDTSGDLYVIVSSRKKLFLFKWAEKEKEFIEVQLDYNPVFIDTPNSIKCVGETVYFSVRNEYFSMTMQKDKNTSRSPDKDQRATSPPIESWNGFITRLLSFNCQPGIIPMIDRNRVAFVRNETVVTKEVWGKPNGFNEEFKFSEVPTQIVYDPPYLVGMLSKGRVEVRSIFDGQLVQTMSLPKAMTLCSGSRGQVFVAAFSDIWILDTSQNLRKNVSHLIQERQFELAIQLADNSDLFNEDQKTKIKREAAVNLFNQRKFDESFAMFKEIKTEVLSILRMFPELLPDGFQSSTVAVNDMPANERMRALLALGNYLSEIRTEHAKHIDLYNRLRTSGAAKKTDTETLEKLVLTLRVVDTTLLKCHIKTKPALVDSLIRLQNSACTFEDAKKILEAEGRLSSLFVLYESRKKHEMALDLLIEQSSRSDRDRFFDDAEEKIVEYLQSLGNSNLPLILKYAKWVLAKNLDLGVQIFTSDETEMARNLNRKSVVEFLKTECPEAMIPYLEHVIFKWEEPASYFHETLLEYYVTRVNTLFKDYVHAFPDAYSDENITRAGDEDGELGAFRKRLLRFLEVSHSYSPQTVLLQLAPHAFFEERALILGRLKQHDQALALYVNTLKNVPAAEEYCRLYYNSHDETNSQVYLLLFRALVHPNQHHHHSIPFNADSTPFGSFRDDVSEASTIVNSTSSYQPDVNTAIKILAKHADKIDTVAALNMLPATTPLRVVFSAINAVIQTTGRQASTRKMEKSMSQYAMSKKLESKQKAQSTKIIVNFSSECVVCEKKIAVSAFVRYPDGRLAHLYCHNDSQGAALRN